MQAPPAVTAEDVYLLKQIVHALAADVAARDRQKQQELLALEQRLDWLQTRTEQRWVLTQSYVSALNTTLLARKE